MPLLDSIKPGRYRFKIMKWNIVHPYRNYDDGIDLEVSDDETIKRLIERRMKYEVKVKTETLDGIPHGLCLIQYEDEEN